MRLCDATLRRIRPAGICADSAPCQHTLRTPFTHTLRTPFTHTLHTPIDPPTPPIASNRPRQPVTPPYSPVRTLSHRKHPYPRVPPLATGTTQPSSSRSLRAATAACYPCRRAREGRAACSKGAVRLVATHTAACCPRPLGRQGFGPGLLHSPRRKIGGASRLHRPQVHHTLPMAASTAAAYPATLHTPDASTRQT